MEDLHPASLPSFLKQSHVLALAAAACLCLDACSCRQESADTVPVPEKSSASEGTTKGAPIARKNQVKAASPPKVDTKVVEAAVAQIQQAFEKNDAATAIALTHPAVQARYKKTFEKHQGELRRVGTLLSTRKPVVITPEIAEYEVTENGGTFHVTFENVGGKWLLSGL